MEATANKLRAAARMEIWRREAAAGSFWSYCLYHNPTFFLRRPFLQTVAAALQRAFDAYGRGVIYRLAMSLPPRSGKSYISTLFVTFCIGHHPEESIMRNCCDSTLYVKLSRGTLRIIRSVKFAAVFPGVKLREGYANIDSWAVEAARTSSYFGAGIGGRIIGEGASMMLMTDDLFSNWESAASDNNRERTLDWYLSDHDSRSEGCAMRIDVGTRWSLHDVIGKMEESGYYDEVLRIPAMTADGQSFCEDVVTTEELHRKKSMMDDVMWFAEWMQEPVEASGLLILPLSEMLTYNPDEITFTASDYCIAAIDPADKGDDFAAPAAYIHDGYIYIDEWICNSDGLDMNVPAAVDMVKRRSPASLHIEGNGGWIQTAKDIREGVYAQSPETYVLIYNSHENKEARIEAQAFYTRNRCLFRSDWASNPNYAAAVKCITSYVRGQKNKNDDAMDVLSKVIAEARKNNLI